MKKLSLGGAYAIIKALRKTTDQQQALIDAYRWCDECYNLWMRQSFYGCMSDTALAELKIAYLTAKIAVLKLHNKQERPTTKAKEELCRTQVK